MSRPDISDEEWREFNKRYQAYTEMLKPTWSISPDTILVVAGNLLGIVLILKHEKAGHHNIQSVRIRPERSSLINQPENKRDRKRSLLYFKKETI